MHLRPPLETHCPPACLYTDGLSLFGHRAPADRLDSHSQFNVLSPLWARPIGSLPTPPPKAKSNAASTPCKNGSARSRLLPVPPPPLLDLHLALYHQRRRNADGTLDFLGQNWPVTTLRQKTVTLVHHPEQCFWVIPQNPDPKHPVWPTVLPHHRL